MHQKPKMMSFFAGAYGLDLGLEQAGFETIWANEIEKNFVDTIKINRPTTNVSLADLATLDPKNVMAELGVATGEIDLFAGGPPCQPFSTAGRRLSIQDPRGNLILQYINWISVFQPRYFILENVKGLLSAPLRHIPHSQRSKDWTPTSEESRGSALKYVLEQIKGIGYGYSYKLINTANYGVPQTRERIVIIGSRDGNLPDFPVPTHSADGGLLPPWVTLRDAIGDLVDAKQEHATYSPSRLKYITMVPEGGNWRSLPLEFQPEAMGGAYASGGGKMGFYRRLSWDKPSPTVTTAPHQKATDMCHPLHHRPLSVREYARIQQFPDSWVFIGSTSQKYKQIGNAVPVGMGYALGGAIVKALQLNKVLAQV